MLELEPVLVENSPDESPSGDGEAALMECHERDDLPSRQARH
jgi:hypothetical protein